MSRKARQPPLDNAQNANPFVISTFQARHVLGRTTRSSVRYISVANYSISRFG
jgi:hypothetical protein